LLFETEREDRAFVVLASLVFVLALIVSLWEFVAVQGMVFRFSVLSITGLVLFVVGVGIRLVGKRTLASTIRMGCGSCQITSSLQVAFTGMFGILFPWLSSCTIRAYR
jgi:hypothetical protein